MIRARRAGFTPAMAVVLGSGLGGLAEGLQATTVIPYAELPGFPQPAVAGHAGRLILGQAGDVPLALLQGRAHFYESGRADAMRPVIDTLARLGCPALLLTCAAGSLRADIGPGSIVMVTDHINFNGPSPLIGEPGDGRFVDMEPGL